MNIWDGTGSDFQAFIFIGCKIISLRKERKCTFNNGLFA